VRGVALRSSAVHAAMIALQHGAIRARACGASDRTLWACHRVRHGF